MRKSVFNIYHCRVLSFVLSYEIIVNLLKPLNDRKITLVNVPCDSYSKKLVQFLQKIFIPARFFGGLESFWRWRFVSPFLRHRL